MNEELKEQIKEYLKNNLEVTVDVNYSYAYDGHQRVEVTLFLEGEQFSRSSDSLPSIK